MPAGLLATDDHRPHSPGLPCVDAREFPAHKSADETVRDLEAAFRRGEVWAAERLIEHAAPNVTALVRRLLAWPADVEDVVQDVFVSALVARKRFRGEARFETWVTRIAVNRCRAHNRRRWMRQRLFAAWREQRLARPPSGAADPHLLDEQAEEVRRAVAGLPHAYREVVVLFYLEQLPAKDVARILGIKTNTVEKRLSRARESLARKLAGTRGLGKELRDTAPVADDA